MTSMGNYIIISFVALIGLIIGSFLNVAIHRVPTKTMFKNNRSECPNCHSQLKWYHNIPLLSYLFLAGKCSFCKKKISFRYPLVELLNSIFYGLLFWKFSFTTEFAVFALIISSLIVIFFIDLDHQIIPDVITLPGIIVGLAVSMFPDGIGIINALIGFLVGGGALYLVAILGDFLFKKDSMGGGDIKMAAMLGAFLGWQKVLLIFMLSSVIGLVISIAIMTVSEKLRKERLIPFGPFIAIAAVIAISYGDQIIYFYQQNFLYNN